MKAVLTILVGLVCFGLGLVAGTAFAPQLKNTAPGRWVESQAAELPIARKLSQSDKDGPFESDEYPTLKWRPKPLADSPDSIVRLWTKYESAGAADGKGGVLKYKLTLYKPVNRNSREVQLLDRDGFKIMQFNVDDFHEIAGSADLVEARDSFSCPESDYKKARDYSVR